MAEQEKENLEEEINETEMAQDEDVKEDLEGRDADSESPEDELESEQEDTPQDGAEEIGTDEEGSKETQGGKSWAEKKAAKKQAKQDKKTDAYKEKIEQLEDRVKRQMAEFENFRKRSDREKQAMFETGARSVLEKILPVVDNFERGLQTVPEEQREDPFVDGMNRIYKQLLTELENIGVAPIEAVGQEFDPNLHNAVMQVESEEYESGFIVQELQKGYTYHDTVIRHSMVSVSE